MLANLARAVFGSHNERVLRRLQRNVLKINALEAEIAPLTDVQLQAQTQKFRERLAAGATLDELLPEAFATVREAAKRVLGQRHFDVQLLGGMILHEGRIAEMRTGEGKTLVATLPVYLNALSGKGVHVVTVNDYLAKRDSGWMGRVYRFLGLSTGCIVHELTDAERQAAYAADITYGTNNEFGFDYLRDNMKFAQHELVQRPFNFAIVDEVDSILVDEARTPLIISGPAEDSSELYTRVDALIPRLKESDYEKDEKARTVILTEAGNEAMESLLAEAGLLAPGGGLYAAENIHLVHHANQALRAHKLFSRDTDYIVKDDKVIIIDEFTGRMMEGRRFSEGLHQALEAKEHVSIQRENQTLASITFQNYFRLYPKLAGMTGTAMTEAAEFAEIYGLEVIEVPTNVGVQRRDEDDEVYQSLAEKHEAIVELLAECLRRGQPVLVGTVSIEKSEQLSALLSDRAAIKRVGERLQRQADEIAKEQEKLKPAQEKHKFLEELRAPLAANGAYLLELVRDAAGKKTVIPHHVLNARYHEMEAQIISQAGRPGAVTIATNMAGRGTDIQLGGNLEMRIEQELRDVTDPEARAAAIQSLREEIEACRAQVKAAGGLFVIGTERHESRRIDNQLRGRSGRQGDPGASRFFLSLEDDLMRIFGSDRMAPLLAKLGLRDGEKIAHPLITRRLAKAQEKVEQRNFDIRKNLLKYDNIMNDQRKVIYEQRRDIMATEDLSETIAAMRDDVIDTMVARAIPAGSYAEQWDIDGLIERARDVLGIDFPFAEWAKEDNIAEAEFAERIRTAAAQLMQAKEAQLSSPVMRQAEKAAMLAHLDQLWKDHLLALDHVRQAIHLRGYGQRDPISEYTREAFELFQLMINQLSVNVTRNLMRAQVHIPTVEELIARQHAQMQLARQLTGSDPDATAEALPAGMRRASDAPSQPQTLEFSDFNANDPETWGRTPRNAACPCGSGKKYKHCHGRV
jgi:preprotein translocase subunit SecA